MHRTELARDNADVNEYLRGVTAAYADGGAHNAVQGVQVYRTARIGSRDVLLGNRFVIAREHLCSGLGR
ncbi:MAG: hypothetical protein M3406_09010 [Chloroflexota bacterium]|nr:hypothetical protein [Chloroflexota bacterium]